MTEPTVTCPSCGSAIRLPGSLAESLAAPLIAATRREADAKLAAARADLGRREAALAAEVEAKIAGLRERLAAEAAAKAAAALEEKGRAVEEMAARLAAQEAKLAEAQAAQVEVLRKERALEDQRRELDLTVEKRVTEQLVGLRDKARAEAEDALRLKVAEKEEVIAAMRREIDALRRRAEQGSQQLQGEVLELDLETRLRARFPLDAIEAVAKGESGADLIQRVTGAGGEACGAILWESKRTKGWHDAWVAKLKGDQRALGAEVALLVSEALPKGVEGFELIDGVWVAAPRTALPLATALRQGLIGLATANAAREGQGTKMELVYAYLTGPRFRHRIEAIVERFSDMSADLDRERRATVRLWAKREAQIQGVIEATVGMYGDLQGIAGKALAEIEGLELPLLDHPERDAEAGG